MSVTQRLNCPQCRAEIGSTDAWCLACGANIALVTLLAEQQWVGRAQSGTGRLTTGPLRPLSVEQLIPRLGDYLLAHGYITETQLRAALARREESGPRLIGQILVDMGALNRETLDRVVAKQILQLQNALLESNRNLERSVIERTAELEQALVKLTELNQLKSNIVSNISHELRTPLTQIKGYTVLLADEMFGPVVAEQRDALTSTLEAIERLERLIDDLISYASAAKGEMTLKLQALDVRPILESVSERSRMLAERKHSHYELQASSQLPRVHADEEKLRWTLLQLTDNAIKFTPAHGQVWLSVAPEAGNRVRFSVRDTGIGIPPNRLSDIFEDFQQLDGSASRRYGGTGLGLALVRRIVEAHGAQISVESQADRGSAFTFALRAVIPES
ncbi:MAG: sensor histidine kinase [Anaerolineales bacterium]